MMSAICEQARRKFSASCIVFIHVQNVAFKYRITPKWRIFTRCCYTETYSNSSFMLQCVYSNELGTLGVPSVVNLDTLALELEYTYSKVSYILNYVFLKKNLARSTFLMQRDYFMRWKNEFVTPIEWCVL